MTVLRSREVVSTPRSTGKKRGNEGLEPVTPAITVDVSSALPAEVTPLSGSSRKRSVPPGGVRRRSLRLAEKSGGSCVGEDIQMLGQEGSRIAAEEVKSKCDDGSAEQVELLKQGSHTKRRHMKVDAMRLEAEAEDGSAKSFLSLRSGKKIAKREVELMTCGPISVSGGIEDDHKCFPIKVSEDFGDAIMTNSDSNACGDGSGKDASNNGLSRLTVEEKGKGKVDDELSLMASDSVKLDVDSQVDLSNENRDDTSVGTMRRLSREEKGKGPLIGDDSSDVFGPLDEDSRPELETSDLAEDDAEHGEEEVTEPTLNVSSGGYRQQQFKDIARRNASRFAFFPQEEEILANDEDARETRETQPEEKVEVEDWPGPFSTAMKVIRDREKNINVHTERGSIPKSMTSSLKWTPKSDMQTNHGKIVPSLQDLSMAILVKNADAITSLDSVPDVIKHKLCHLLCDSGKMNSHFLGLLTLGSPTEIRLRDCSWLTEELFVKYFEGCDGSKLAVLQLDQSGRCLPDYILLATLARSPSNLPALTTLSLKGACRLSDVGLTALVSSAASLRSINLSQCSLLTSNAIKSLSDSLGSVLKELYLDDCQAIDCALVLPSLLKLEQLEVLSVAGIDTVSDDFVIEFVTRLGHNLKELILRDCVKLTDSSVKAVAESCPGLCAIDLSNLCMLTDSAVGYLANGCRALQKLMLCRNEFSDEAIAAYLEASGNSLNELSLNNIKKVSFNTAISLAKCCRNLRRLDLSWCRNLTNEALGLIADSCLSLELLKLFGCTQITNVFSNGHSNARVKVIGLKLTPLLEHMNLADTLQGPLLYSSVSPSS